MATSWVLGKISDALQPTVQSTVSTAGTYAGGAFNTVGNSINGVGQSINGTIKRYGDGVRDYGNGVMDWTSGTGPRAQTASNPLGLSSGKTGGKRAVTSPSVYAAPPKAKLPASKPTATTKATTPTKKVGTSNSKAVTPVKKAGSATTKPISTQARPVTATKSKPAVTKSSGIPAKKATTGVKSSSTAAPKAKPPSTQKTNYVAASNPLGLK